MPTAVRTSISPLLRCNFVYVPQGNTLLSGTIRDNLLMGCPDDTDDERWRVLSLVCGDFVATLPQGLDTVCTEAGGGLSEGQAQRIAIARALLRNRSIMLFDEATSALDPDTERQLLENILSDHSKTVIFITHRPLWSTIATKFSVWSNYFKFIFHLFFCLFAEFFVTLPPQIRKAIDETVGESSYSDSFVAFCAGVCCRQ